MVDICEVLKASNEQTMIFRVKYLIAGPAAADELYNRLKTELEENCRYQISDVCEAEVLGPCPQAGQASFSTVPVTFKIDTHGYDTEGTILFDLFMLMSFLRSETYSFTSEGIAVGLQEIVVDGERFDIPDTYMLGVLPVVEI
jgi:hypothetical protein